ncbi:MAG TPA: MDR family MFS transporter [Actinomycetales bacterium]|jgi:EmrB/QacA subfamily drug resistance transporter
MSTETSTRAAAGPAAEAGPAAGSLTHRQILTILGGLMMGMFLAALDQTIVASAIRTIADDLRGLSVQAWVTTAYLITSTITTPLYGKLSDIYGRKPLFVTAITIFVIGSALSAFATSMYMLAGFRALQGLGAGGLFSLALAIIGDIVSPRERAKYQGYFLAVFGTSSVLGPVVGGFFAGADTILGITGWRWVFLVNVPIGIVALYVVNRTLNIEHHPRDHRIDYWGATALVVGLVPLLTIAEQGRTWGWDSGRAIACYVIGAIGVVGFILAERMMGEEALIPLRLFKDRTVGVSTVANVVIGMAMFGGISVLPLYLQIVKGSSPTAAGLQLLPLTLGIMTASILSGQIISRTGRYKVFPIIGTSLMLVGLILFSGVGADTPIWQTMVVMAIFGFGLGNNLQPLVLAIQNVVSPRDIGVATSSATFFRQIGGTLGVAVFLSILFSSVPGRLDTAIGDLSQADQAALQRALPPGGGDPLSDSSFIQQLPPVLAKPFLVGFSEAMDLVFITAAVVAAIGLVVVFFLPQLPLRETSGLEAAAAERAADAEAAADAERVASGDTDDAVDRSSAADPVAPSVVAPTGGAEQADDPTPEYRGKHERRD